MIAVNIDKPGLLREAALLKGAGNRFVTITCVRIDQERVELIYHFDRDLELTNLRLALTRDEPVPSISGIYFAAFLAENEVQDLFGLKFEGLVLDYKGGLYLEPEAGAAPFMRRCAPCKDK